MNRNNLGIASTLRVVLLAIGIAGCLCVAVSARVKISSGEGFEEIKDHVFDGVEYLSLTQLARIIGGDVDWIKPGHTVSYKSDDFSFEFLVGSPFCKLGGAMQNLTYKAQLYKGELFLPVVTFIPILDKAHPQQIRWDDARQLISMGSGSFTINDLSFATKANGLLIELDLSDSLAYDVFVTEGNWVNISIRDGKVNGARIESRKDNRFVYKISTHQEGTTAQVSFQLKEKINKWYHSIASQPWRIQISIPDINFSIDSLTTAHPTVGDNIVDVIIIDAGHGGVDKGAIGHKGTKEKDVCLAIAKEVATQLRKEKGLKVIMTRDADETVSLQKRAEIANNAKADLFISIHANANPKRYVRGWNVFFLAPAKNDSARSVEQLENSYVVRELAESEFSASDSDNADPVLSILNDMIMTEYQAESQELALMIDREFRANLTIPARGVDQAGFFVLNKIFMPSVLVETAFISNASEEKLLKDKSFQSKLAEGIADAVIRFRDKYSKEVEADNK